MALTWSVAVDLDDDGSFVDVGSSLTADVLKLSWRLGMERAFDMMAPPAEAVIELSNVVGTYRPDLTENWKPGKPVRIQSDDGVTVRTHFTGFIRAVRPSFGISALPVTTIIARDHLDEIKENRVRLPVTVDAAVNTVLTQVLDACRLRYPILDGFLVIGITGRNLVGTHKLFGSPYTASLDTAKSLVAYPADAWGDELSAYDAIKQLVEYERGRFFASRDNTLRFLNRHYTLLNTSIAATISSGMSSVEALYGEGQVTWARAHYQPRATGGAGTVLWSAGVTIELPALERKEIVATFRDSLDHPVGALTVIAPFPVTDYAAWSLSDGTGVNLTSDLVVSLLAVTSGAAARLELRNRSETSMYITFLQVRGTPLSRGDPGLVEVYERERVTLDRLRLMDFQLPLLVRDQDAGDLMRYELGRRRLPRTVVEKLTLGPEVAAATKLPRTLFERITVSDAASGHTANYLIVGEAHEVDSLGYKTTWTLEPMDADIFVIIGTSKPDGSRVLAY